MLPQAFNAVYGNKIGTFSGIAMRIRTVTPADVPAVTASARRIFGHVPNFIVQSLNIDNTGAGNAIHVLAIALFIFAAVTAIAGIAAIAIVLDRELSSSQPQQPTLLALGVSRRQRFSINLVRALVVAAIGAPIAVAAAIALSPLFPFGVARRADPDPGLHADWLVLGLGIIAILVAVLAIGVVAAVRATRGRRRTCRRPTRPSSACTHSSSATRPACP